MTDQEIVAEIKRLRIRVGGEVVAFFARLTEMDPEDAVDIDGAFETVLEMLSGITARVIETVENRP